MKTAKYISIALVFIAMLTMCKPTQNTGFFLKINDSIALNSSQKLLFQAQAGKGFNYPTFVIWVENMNGELVKTLYLTKSYASGIFGYQMVGDSIWINKAGTSIQPAALPYWTHKKGLINGKNLVPNPESPYLDGFTGATPSSSFELKTAVQNQNQNFRILLEVNQTWDWNKFWTNNKFPESRAYKHSAQPSLVYAVTVNNSDKEYYMNLIGHGDPKGESGKLFTDLRTFTTAKEIFESIKIEVLD